jgi:hypothetical protein
MAMIWPVPVERNVMLPKYKQFTIKDGEIKLLESE